MGTVFMLKRCLVAFPFKKSDGVGTIGGCVFNEPTKLASLNRATIGATPDRDTPAVTAGEIIVNLQLKAFKH